MGDDGSAVLVVVKHWNAKVEQLLFHFEATRCGNVLEVDAAEDRRDGAYGSYDLIDVLCVEADRKAVDVGECLEQDRFAFHHRNGCLSTEVAEAENSRTIRNDGDGIVLDREVVDSLGVFVDRGANRGNTGRVGGAQVVARLQGHLALYRKLAVQTLVHSKGFVIEFTHGRRMSSGPMSGGRGVW